MKLPKKVKIGGHIWAIEYPYMFKERFDRYGACDDARKIIMITALDGNGNKRAESSIIVTFIHEILHAMDFCCSAKAFAGDDGETKCEALSEVIFQVLQDNEIDISHETR